MDRINEGIMRELAVLLREVKDPRVHGLVSVLRAETTSDLRYCKVYVSVLESGDKREVLGGLRSASGFLRREIGRRVGLRQTPELTFVMDDSISYGAHISKILGTLDIAPEPKNDDS